MSRAVTAYETLVAALAARPGVEAGQMFGKPCLKVKGKAFLAHHLETVVFKLAGSARETALATAGAMLWDPSGKGRPMREWVAVPAAGSRNFEDFAHAALDYVGTAP